MDGHVSGGSAPGVKTPANMGELHDLMEQYRRAREALIDALNNIEQGHTADLETMRSMRQEILEWSSVDAPAAVPGR